jgi:exopolysaccharide biosynthesis polyprenyl glycosylphosphotransferase
MHNKAELTFTVIKVPLDFVMLVLAGVVAYFLRFEEMVTEIKPILFELPFEKFFVFTLIVAAAWIVFFAIARLYPFQPVSIVDEIRRIVLACSTGMSAVIIYMFFIRELFDSRFIILTAWIFSIIFVTISRVILRKIQHLLYRKRIGTHRVVIIGKNKETKDIVGSIQTQPRLGLEIIEHIQSVDAQTEKQLLKLHRRKFIDEIIQTDSTISRKDTIKLMDFAEANNITFMYAAGTFEARTTNINVHMIGGIPIIQIQKTKLEGWGKVWKRIIDFFFALILIIVFSPLMLIVALAIKLESRGPVIFKNERVKKGGTFNVYKFRSMYSKYCVGEQFKKYTDQKAALEYEKKLIEQKSERQGPVYKILRDPRRTKVGRFIERTSLDELPQLFNVLIGNMSLVGPRPHQPREVAQYQGYQKRVLDIKPGVTGLPQISGRSDLDFEEEVKLDIYYIENWSLKLDFWLMLKTPWIVLRRKAKS